MKPGNVLRVSLFQHHEVVCDSFLMVYLPIISFLPWTERAARWRHWLPERLCRNRLLSGGHLIQFWVATQKAPYRHAAVGEVLRLQRVTGHRLKLHFTTVLAPFNGTNRLVSRVKICLIANVATWAKSMAALRTQKEEVRRSHSSHYGSHWKMFWWRQKPLKYQLLKCQVYLCFQGVKGPPFWYFIQCP